MGDILRTLQNNLKRQRYKFTEGWILILRKVSVIYVFKPLHSFMHHKRNHRPWFLSEIQKPDKHFIKLINAEDEVNSNLFTGY